MNKNSIKNLMKKARALIKEYQARPVDDVRVTVSTGNIKIGNVLNFSKMPILSCGNCKECHEICYDIKACAAYPSCLDSRCRNYVLMLTPSGRDKAFAEILKRMTSRRAKRNQYYRHDVGGELMDIDEIERLVNVAKARPDYFVWTYTKMHALVNMYVKAHGDSIAAAIPSNMCIMFSEWDGMPTINPYGFPVFVCELKAGNKDRSKEELNRMFHCPGNCNLCKPEMSADGRAHGCIAKEDVVTKEH